MSMNSKKDRESWIWKYHSLPDFAGVSESDIEHIHIEGITFPSSLGAVSKYLQASSKTPIEMITITIRILKDRVAGKTFCKLSYKSSRCRIGCYIILLSFLLWLNLYYVKIARVVMKSRWKNCKEPQGFSGWDITFINQYWEVPGDPIFNLIKMDYWNFSNDGRYEMKALK